MPNGDTQTQFDGQNAVPGYTLFHGKDGMSFYLKGENLSDSDITSRVATLRGQSSPSYQQPTNPNAAPGNIQTRPGGPVSNVNGFDISSREGFVDSLRRIAQAAQAPPPETGVWAGVKRNTVGMVTGLYHALADPATDLEKAQLMQKVQAERVWQTMHGYDPNQVDESLATNPSRATLAYHRLIDAPAGFLQQKGSDEQAAAKDLLSRGDNWQGANLYASGLADKTLSALPLAGPFVNSIAQRAESGDVSGAATDIAAALALAKAPEIVGRVAPKAADFLKSSAQKNYEDVLNPTKQTTKYQTQKIMPQLLEERPISMTRKGLAEKATGRAEEAGQKIEQTVSGLQGNMNTQPVIDGLQNLKKSFQVNGVSLRPEVDSAIDAVSQQMQAMGPDISLQDAVKARRILDTAVNEGKGFQGAQLSEASMTAIRKEAANSIRSELGQASPDLAAVNAKFHFWNTLSDVLDATIQRKTGQVGALGKVETVVAGAGGLARHGLTGAAGYAATINLLGKAFRSTGWRTVSAATKGSIADALASGKFDTAVKLLGSTGVVGQALSEGAQQ
jgi:hypothetical protein